MNLISTGCIVLVAISYALVAGQDDTNAVAESPPNEWGTYFSLPNMTDTMAYNFVTAFRSYVTSADKKTLCKDGDADFERWYKSSKNPNYYILSYYCRTKEARGYEHLQVELTNGGKTFNKVVNFQTSLKGFGITDAGDYSAQVNDVDAQKLQSDLLEKVKDQLGYQMNKWNGKELCPEPGNRTFFSVETKKENGLYYYRFAISCNISDTTGYAPDYMANIEVAWDKDFKLLNGGEPILAAMEDPMKNTQFIQQRELEALKQSDSSMIVPVLSLALFPLGKYLL